MAQNTCTPASIYGPFEQTLFLGCSVESFTASAGWNEQSSSLNVTVFQDDCTAPVTQPKYYWDSNLYKQSTTAADPGFIGESYEIIGSPAYFRVGDFEYSGIIQSWERVRSASRYNAYSITLSDPREILAGTELIINEYAGAVYNEAAIANLFNVFGYMEQYGVLCPQYYQSDQGVYSPGDESIDGAVFGTPAGGFGGSWVNDNGMQWNRMKAAFNILANSPSPVSNSFSPYGRILYSASATSGYGLLGADRTISTDSGYNVAEYLVDLSEIPDMPTYWRMDGSNVGLLDTITQVCSEAGFDYYIELLPIRGALSIASGSGIGKVIKIRTVDRGSVPSSLNHINSFISSHAGVISNSVGRELRNETMSSFVIGGPKETIYQASDSTNPDGDADGTISQPGFDDVVGQDAEGDPCTAIDDMLLPYFGLDSNNDFIVPCKDDDDYWYFEMETVGINDSLQNLALPDTVTITETELLFAIAGYDAWLTHETAEKDIADRPDIGANIPVAIEGLYNWNHLRTILRRAETLSAGGNHEAARRLLLTLNPRDIGAGRKKKDTPAIAQVGGADVNLRDDLEAIFGWIEQMARNFYGKKFAVRVPFTCGWLDDESGTVRMSGTPSNSGWTEMESVLGLLSIDDLDTEDINEASLLDFFRDEQGKLTPFVRINGILAEGDEEGAEELLFNLDSLSVDDYIIYNNDLYLKATVEENYIFHDSSTFFAPRVVVEIPNALYKKDDEDEIEARFNFVPKVMEINKTFDDPAVTEEERGELFQDLINGPGAKQLAINVPNKAAELKGASFGLKSNIMSYGPWYNAGAPGKMRIERQEGLVPWEYGSYSTLNEAGQSIADEGLALMQIGEMGNIQIPGMPDIPLCAEIGALAGGYYGGGSNLVENRIHSLGSFNDTNADGSPASASYAYFDFGGNWTGLYGPNITNISVNYGQQVTTTYNLRTFTPMKGRFAKYNAERLRTVGQNKMKLIRKIRSFGLQRLKKERFDNKVAIRRAVFGKNAKPETMHEVIVGQILNWTEDDDYKRTIVGTIDMAELSLEMQKDYDKKAFASFDTLFRPISMDGRGGLPQYVKPTGDACQTMTTNYSQPPVFAGSGDTCESGIGSEYYRGTGISDKINIDYLNPFTNPQSKARSALATDRTNTPDVGHDMEIMGRTGDYEGTPDSGMVMCVAGYDIDEKSDYQDDYGTMALRGPLVLHQWTYDTNGKPVPNSADTELAASGGEFADSGLTCNFLDSHLRKPHTWPVAPVDLRLDRKRGLFVSPPPPRDLIVTLCEAVCPFGSGLAKVDSDYMEEVYDCSGDIIDNPMIYIYDRIGDCHPSGETLVAKYDNVLCEYYPIVTPKSTLKPFQLQACLWPTKAVGTDARLLALEDDIWVPTGDIIQVLPGLAAEWGPSASGMSGWAEEICSTGTGLGGCSSAYYIVGVEHFAKKICYQNAIIPGVPCTTSGKIQTVGRTWDGIPPSIHGYDAWLMLPCPDDDPTIGVSQDLCTLTEAGVAVLIDYDDDDCEYLHCPTGGENGRVFYEPIRFRQHLNLISTLACDGSFLASYANNAEPILDLNVGPGLLGSVGSNCDLTLSLDLMWKSSPLSSYECSGTFDDVYQEFPESGVFANIVTFGRGLKVYHSVTSGPPTSCDLLVESEFAPLTQGTGNYAKLELGDCFSISGNGAYDSDCERWEFGTISLSGGVAGCVEYVEDVMCSDSQIVITTQYLNFNECGLFIGTGTGCL
jgi:hypothetical protein